MAMSKYEELRRQVLGISGDGPLIVEAPTPSLEPGIASEVSSQADQVVNKDVPVPEPSDLPSPDSIKAPGGASGEATKKVTSDSIKAISEATREASESVSEEVKPVETLRFKVGDNFVEVPLDAEIELDTKTGKSTKLKASELKNDYWGKQEISRRFSEFDKLKKDLEGAKTSQEFLSSVKAQLEDAVKKKDSSKFVSSVLQFAVDQLPEGQDLLQDYYNNLYKEFQELNKLPEDAKKAKLLEKENTQLKDTLKNKEAVRQQAVMEEQAEVRASSIKEKFNLDSTSWVALVDKLEQAGLVTDSTPLPKALETMEQYAELQFQTIRAETALEKVDKSLITNQQALKELIYFQKLNPQAELEEILVRADKLFGPDKAEKEIQKRAEKNAQATGKLPAEKPTPKNTHFSQPFLETITSDPVNEFLRKRGINNSFF